jgi:hypothetical protein
MNEGPYSNSYCIAHPQGLQLDEPLFLFLTSTVLKRAQQDRSATLPSSLQSILLPTVPSPEDSREDGGEFRPYYIPTTSWHELVERVEDEDVAIL